MTDIADHPLFAQYEPSVCLAVSNLACRRAGRVVFSGLSFELGAGRAMMLKGPNGVGKSSLLRIVAGLLRPFAGELRFAGQTIADDPKGYHASLVYIGHHNAVKPALTVRENLRFWAGPGGEMAVASALDALGIGPLADIPGRFLSAGQQRRLNLARLAVLPCQLWLLDEAAAALDTSGVKLLKDLIQSHVGRGGMVLASSHGELEIENSVMLRLTPKLNAVPESQRMTDDQLFESW